MNLFSSLFTTSTTNRPIAIIAVIATVTMLVQGSLNVGYAQTMAVKEKEDVFKVLVTLFGVEPTTGNIVTFVTIDNMPKVKAFDAAKYYILIDTTAASYNSTINAVHGSSNGVEGSGIVELNLALYSDVFRFSSVNKKKVLTNIYNPLYPDSLFGFKQTF